MHGLTGYDDNLSSVSVSHAYQGIKRVTRPMLGLKDFHFACVILSGIEMIHMIKKGPMKCSAKFPLSNIEQFYFLDS